MQFIYVFLDFKNYQKSTFFAKNTRQRIKWEFLLKMFSLKYVRNIVICDNQQKW